MTTLYIYHLTLTKFSKPFTTQFTALRILTLITTTYYGCSMYEDLVVHMYSWADFSFIPMLTYITYCRDIYHLSAVFLYVMLKLGKCTV